MLEKLEFRIGQFFGFAMQIPHATFGFKIRNLKSAMTYITICILAVRPTSSAKGREADEISCFSLHVITLNMKFSLPTINSSTASTIRVKLVNKPPLRAECSATFDEPPPTVNAPICYVHLRRPIEVYASAELLVRQPTFLFCSGEVSFILSFHFCSSIWINVNTIKSIGEKVVLYLFRK